MCGIIGYIAKGTKTPDQKNFERTIDLLSHRGPDRRGVWIGDGAGLGFRRLSIIDLETGDQPMTNEDRSLWIVFNGEIYNFQSIREKLIAQGHRFQTRSDAEVILHLYEEKGGRCVEDLRGMFAFAIYDVKKKTLFLARDRFGKKPLVYAETPTGFYFASEIRPLLELADISKELDLPALDAYFGLQYVPTPHTAWKKIKRLPPASTLVFRNGIGLPVQRYWHLDWSAPENMGAGKDVFEKFREIFEESVKLRMISDVPLGAFLSGGVDSSVTVAAMTRLGAKVKTFSIGFEDEKFDETPYARQIARCLGTDHNEILVAPDSLEPLDGLIEKMGEPFADQSLLLTHRVSQFARQNVTVALSGDGGDELFGGYKRYQYMKQAALIRSMGVAKPKLTLSRLLFAIEQLFNSRRRSLQWPRSALDRILSIENPMEQYMALIGGSDATLRKSLWKKQVSGDLTDSYLKNASLRALSGTAFWQALDTETYLTDDILRKVDIASMACSLECRSPLLDHHVAQFTATLPDSLKMGPADQSKILLRNLYPDLISPSLFERSKKGFSLPLGSWMRKQWKETIRASIDGSWDAGMERNFERGTLQRLWQEHQEGREDHGQRLWAWFVFFKWNQRFQPVWD